MEIIAILLGLIYMAWGWPNNAMGQYFTSGEICKMMARMVMGDIEGEIKARVLAAAQHSPVAQAALLTGLAIDDPDEAVQWLLDRVIPACAPYLEPITVLDCCCGSGAMFLGFAAHCPRWALNLGLIQFYGQDIDMTCVLMAKINLMIHNLNGYGIKCALALSEAELAQLPAPVAEIYREAQHVKDDPAQLAVLAMQARAVNGQLALFPDDLLADQPPPARRTTAKADKQRASRGGTNGVRLATVCSAVNVGGVRCPMRGRLSRSVNSGAVMSSCFKTSKPGAARSLNAAVNWSSSPSIGDWSWPNWIGQQPVSSPALAMTR